MTRERVRATKALVAVKEAVHPAPPMVLASGNEAVAGIAEKLMKLSPAQRTFLRLRYYYETDKACAEKVGVVPQTVRMWKQVDQNFLVAYNELLTQPLLHARAEMLLLTSRAINVLGEMLDSPDMKTRAMAVDRVLKGRDAQIITSTVKVETSDEGDVYVALMQRLAQRNTQRILPPTTADDETVEGEFKVIEHEKTT